MALNDDADKFAAELAKASETALPIAARAIGQSLLAIQGEIARVPPQPSRTRAKTFNTWVREIGRLPKASFEQVDGEWQRKRKGAYSSKKWLSLKSQMMAKKWRTQVTQNPSDVTGELRNDARYSGFVVGTKNQGKDPHQVPFHAQTGWPNADDSVRLAQPAIDAIWGEAINGVVKVLIGKS